MVLLNCDREDANHGAHEWSIDHWVGDRLLVQKVMVNVEPFTKCGKQEGKYLNELSTLHMLLCLEERKSEELQNGKYVHDLLGHPQQVLRVITCR